MRRTKAPGGVILLGISGEGPPAPRGTGPRESRLFRSAGRWGGEAAPTNRSVTRSSGTVWTEEGWYERDVPFGELSHFLCTRPVGCGRGSGTLCSANSPGTRRILPKTSENLGSASVYLRRDPCSGQLPEGSGRSTCVFPPGRWQVAMPSRYTYA